jgi:hypothetical protein
MIAPPSHRESLILHGVRGAKQTTVQRSRKRYTSRQEKPKQGRRSHYRKAEVHLLLSHFWLLLEPILAQMYSLVPSIVAQLIVRLLTIWMGRLLSTWQAGGSNARGSNLV